MGKEAPKEVVVDDKPEIQEEVTVHLDDKNEPIKAEEPKKPEPQYVTVEQLEQIRKAQNYANASSRKAQEDIQRILETINTLKPQVAANPSQPVTEWDEKLQKNWKGTVEELAEKKAEELYKRIREEEKQKEAIEAQQRRTYELLENNKRQVIERHPELNDDASEKARIFQEVLTHKPEYLSNPFGPVLAMRDMEDKLREMGVIDEPVKRVVDKELTRQARANASAAQSTSRAGQQKITLSKEDRIFCDAQGIKYEVYAKYLAGQKNNKEGVEA